MIRRNCCSPCFESTFVIAAVSVVFPWSICPIVPMLKFDFASRFAAFAAGAEANRKELCELVLGTTFLSSREQLLRTSNVMAANLSTNLLTTNLKS